MLAQIHVISPKVLKDQFPKTLGTVYGTTATFGAPYFGSRVLGKLLYGESKGKNHCENDDYAVTKPADGSNLLSVVIVRRGECTFAQKVLIAEKYKDASAVIIVDKESSTKTAEQIQATIMADDEKRWVDFFSRTDLVPATSKNPEWSTSNPGGGGATWCPRHQKTRSV